MNPDWSLSTGRDYTEKQSWMESRLWVNSLETISVEHDIFLPLEYTERQDSSLPHCLSLIFSFFFCYKCLSICVCTCVCIVEVVLAHVSHHEPPCKTLSVPQWNTSPGTPTTTKTNVHLYRGFLKLSATEQNSQLIQEKFMTKCCGGFMFYLCSALMHPW